MAKGDSAPVSAAYEPVCGAQQADVIASRRTPAPLMRGK